MENIINLIWINKGHYSYFPIKLTENEDINIWSFLKDKNWTKGEKTYNTLFIFSQNILSSSARKLIPSFICFYLWGYIKVIKSMKSFCAFAERSKGIFIFSITRHTKNSVKNIFSNQKRDISIFQLYSLFLCTCCQNVC